MSELTETAARERMWGWLPALRLILESKRVPDHYYGASTASDNLFERIDRLLKTEILIRENSKEIVERLRTSSRELMVRDLSHVRDAFKHTAGQFQEAAERLDKIIRSGH